MSLTNFPNGITSFGIPIVGSGGGIPSTFGDYYFVNADTNAGSNYNDGKSAAAPFATIAKAYSMVVDGHDDVIVLSGNSAHVLTAMLPVAKSRVHFVGTGGVRRKNAQGSRITMGLTAATADIAMVKVTGGRVTFQNIKFYSANTLAQHLYTVLDNSDGGVYENCCFEANHKLSTATVAELLCQGTGTRYIDCEIGGDSYVCSVARAALLFDASVGALSGADGIEFDNCRFIQWTSTAAKYLIVIAAEGDLKGWCIMDACQFITKVAEGTLAATYVVNPPASLTTGDLMVSYPRFFNFTAFAVNSDASGVTVVGPTSAAFTGAPITPHTS